MDLIANYEPRKITADRWAVVSGFVRATVAESYTDDDSLVAVRNATGLLARLAEWVHIVHGHPLDATHVLDHELIEMFVAHELSDLSQRTRGRSRSILLRMARTSNPVWNGPAEGPQYGYRGPLAPYTDAELVAARDPELVAVRRERLTRLTNALVAASVRRMPKAVREKWNGDVVVDATPIPAARLGTSKRSSRVSSEPDAGWYTRRDDHDGGDGTEGKVFWAYEATLVAAMMPDGAPHPIIGIALDKPGHQPHMRARDALAHITADADMPKGNLVGDMLYHPNGKPETWQIPMRRAGYTLVGDLPINTRGVTANYAGAVQVGGAWHCPAMPTHLLAAGDDHRAGIIDDDQFAERIEARTAFALRVKERLPGGGAKYMCPARGSGATVSCPLVKGSGKVGSQRVKIFRSQVPAAGERGRCCTNASSVTIPVEEGAKFAQQGPAWRTSEWKKAYQPPQATIESRNAILKTGAGAGLGDTTRRMIRGFTAAALFVALGAVAVNVALIARFIGRGGTTGGAPVPPSPSPRRESGLDEAAAVPNAPPLAA